MNKEEQQKLDEMSERLAKQDEAIKEFEKQKEELSTVSGKLKEIETRSEEEKQEAEKALKEKEDSLKSEKQLREEEWENKLSSMAGTVEGLNKQLNEEKQTRKSAEKSVKISSLLSGYNAEDVGILSGIVSSKITVLEDGELFAEGFPSAKALVDSIQESKPFLFKKSGSAGSGHYSDLNGKAGLDNPFSKDGFNLTKQIQMARENPALAEHLKSKAI